MAGKRITEVIAFVALDSDGDEGIPAFWDGRLMLPLIAADSHRVESLLPIARRIAEETGIEIQVLRFTVREQIDVLNPRQPTP